MFKVKYPHMQ